jgi:hypothetical protein
MTCRLVFKKSGQVGFVLQYHGTGQCLSAISCISVLV